MGDRVIITLGCTDCKDKNYTMQRGKKKEFKIELKKHCRKCGHIRKRDDGPDEETANRRFEAAMCFLRGICYAKQNAFDRAKECYKDAVRIDVQHPTGLV